MGEDEAHALDEIVAQVVEPSIAVTIEKEVVNDLPAGRLLASSADADMLVLGARGCRAPVDAARRAVDGLELVEAVPSR